METLTLTPLRQDPAPLRNQIIASLRAAIEAGTLRPGERLVDRELCERLGVSRTSLREALRELQAIGVLSSDNRGLSVAILTKEEASNIYAVRAVVEALVARQYTEKASQSNLNELAKLAQKLTAAYARGSVTDIIASKRALYHHLCVGAQNSIALDLIDRLTLRTSSLRSRSVSRTERQSNSIREIEAIVAAIGARDPDAAAKAASHHVEQAAISALEKWSAEG